MIRRSAVVAAGALAAIAALLLVGDAETVERTTVCRSFTNGEGGGTVCTTPGWNE